MKTRLATPPSLPSLRATLLIAGIFVIPLLLWGDRWPWLVALPVTVIGFRTVRSEWLRIRALNEQKNVQNIEATFLPAAVAGERDWLWYVDEIAACIIGTCLGLLSYLTYGMQEIRILRLKESEDSATHAVEA